MIKVFNSAYRDTDGNFTSKDYQLDDVQIVSQKIDYNGKPYILFEHKDFPLGALRAEFNGQFWACDLD